MNARRPFVPYVLFVLSLMSTITYGALESIQQSVSDYLNADPFFASARTLANGQVVSIPVLPEHTGDIGNLTDKKLNDLGVAVRIITMRANAGARRGEPGPFLEKIFVAAAVLERVVLNRGMDESPSPSGTLVSACAIAETIASLLHYWTPLGLSAPLICEDPTIDPILNKEGEIAGYNVLLATQGTLYYTQTQLAPLTITNSGGNITIASTAPTPGAAIFYTLTGGYPSPPVATLYTAPFATPSPGTAIRAAAWLAGYNTSSAITLNV